MKVERDSTYEADYEYAELIATAADLKFKPEEITCHPRSPGSRLQQSLCMILTLSPFAIAFTINNYSKAEPLALGAPGFHVEVKNQNVRFEFKRHHATEEDVRWAVEPLHTELEVRFEPAS